MTWFTSWFDSPFYHILYQHRNEAEAQFFMDNLLAGLQLPINPRVLDLACGKGRHSIYLQQKGCRVVGADLSPESIAAAKVFENDNLKFVVHDMREPLDKGDFDAVFNLFTSFGYFTNEEEHIAVLLAARKNILAKNGVLVIDFMNAQKVIQNLVLNEEKTVQGINFKIRRYVENGYIVKEICFSDGGEDYRFEERVRGFLLADFEALFDKAGLRLDRCFGNYALQSFLPETADRLILFARPC